ncbi:MAG: hypothetical protein AAF933_15595 [Pseudomonadota bacterium]
MLDYGWAEPISDTLHRNFGRIAKAAEASGAAAIMGMDGVHFADEVFSWHHINGVDGEEILPALLISTLNPWYFRGIPDLNSEGPSDSEDALLIVPLNDLCDSPNDVVRLVIKVFKDIGEGRQLRDFEVAREMRKGRAGAFFDALILKPSFMGMGVDLREAFDSLKKR